MDLQHSAVGSILGSKRLGTGTQVRPNTLSLLHEGLYHMSPQIMINVERHEMTDVAVGRQPDDLEWQKSSAGSDTKAVAL